MSSFVSRAMDTDCFIGSPHLSLVGGLLQKLSSASRRERKSWIRSSGRQKSHNVKMLCCLVTTFSITEIDMDDNDNQQRSLFELFRKANGGEEFYSSNQGRQPTLTKRVLLLRPQSSPSLTKTPHLDTDLVNPSSNISEIYVSGLRKERFITKRDCIKPSWFNELHQITGSSTISIEGGDAKGICC